MPMPPMRLPIDVQFGNTINNMTTLYSVLKIDPDVA